MKSGCEARRRYGSPQRDASVDLAEMSASPVPSTFAKMPAVRMEPHWSWMVGTSPQLSKRPCPARRPGLAGLTHSLASQTAVTRSANVWPFWRSEAAPECLRRGSNGCGQDASCVRVSGCAPAGLARASRRARVRSFRGLQNFLDVVQR